MKEKAEKCDCGYKTTDQDKMKRHKEKYCPLNLNKKDGTKPEIKKTDMALNTDRKKTQRKKAFAYVRASTLLEVKQGSNLRQERLIREYLGRREDWEIELFSDEVKSGKSQDNRPDFQRMMRRIDEKPDIIIVAKIDRFARSLTDLLKVLEVLDSRGIGFLSVGDAGIDTTTPNGRLLLQILGAFAEFERLMINSRTQAGREAAKLKGIRFGRPPMKTGKKNGSRTIDEKRILELKDKGLSARAIAKTLECSKTLVLNVLSQKRNLIMDRKNGGGIFELNSTNEGVPFPDKEI